MGPVPADSANRGHAGPTLCQSRLDHVCDGFVCRGQSYAGPSLRVSRNSRHRHWRTVSYIRFRTQFPVRIGAAVVHREAHQALSGFQRNIPLHPFGGLLVV